MKILKTSLLLILISFNSFSQTYLKEISKTFNNGSPMFIDYLEPDNLKKVKTEIFDESGRKIFSIQFNPNTGLPEGEFFDLINKGFFKEGVLTCYNCLLVDSNSPNVFTYNYNKMNTRVTQGDVINGYLVGEIQYKIFAEDTYRGIDYESSRRYVAAGAGIGFRDVVTYKTGVFKEYDLGKNVLNDRGVIDGDLIFNLNNWQVNIVLKNGIIDFYTLTDNKGISFDSLSNKSNIFKLGYKFYKNNGFVVFKSVEDLKQPDLDFSAVNNDQYYSLKNYFIVPKTRSYELEDYFEKRVKGKEFLAKTSISDYGETDTNGLILLGGNQTFQYEEFAGPNIYEREFTVDTGGPKIGLDNNGLYSIRVVGKLDKILTSNLSVFSRKSNFFVLLYNYLVNNDGKLLSLKFNEYETYSDFISELSEDSKNNPFSKYIFSNMSRNQIDIDNFSLSIQEFFSKVLSIDNYLRACQESLDNKSTEIQKIYVWNYQTKNYDLVDFNKLIELRESKANNFQKSTLSSDSKKELVVSENSPNVIGNKSISNDNQEMNNGLDEIGLISNSEIRYSSEKKTKHYYRPYEKQKEDLNKIYELDLVSINILKPSTEDQVINYITEFSFASNKNIKKFTELMNSDKQYKFYYSDFQRLKIYYKFSDSN